MIELLIFTLGCVAGLALGFMWGHRRGFVTGAKTVPFPFSSPSGAVLPPFQYSESALPRFQCIHRLSVVRTPEERMWQSTYAVNQMCDKIAKQLLAGRIIRPVILEEDEPDGSPLVIGCSFYAVADPFYEHYPNLTFFEQPLSSD
ncbi:MAG: hypothetical protein K2H17_06015 [Duncaniella sp.]|uniref:hypothetical protein n=1 Tax=Duncaniella sp. TaxID=2518496 RepID=UPI0023BE5BE4|nr:hypothetical protein [Duncaniella sp.]MDE5988934.1 hypothetical protein [Duncaniella sp.]